MGSQVTLYIATSVDGYIADENGDVDWLDEFEAGDSEGFDEFFERVDCLVMGATTYEQILGFDDWPYADKPTYVFTHRDLSPATDAVEFVDQPAGEVSRSLRQEHDRIWLVGGATLVQAFLGEHEIDEFRLFFVPILLGSGIPLFDGESDRQRLQLLDVAVRDSGIVEHHYEVGE